MISCTEFIPVYSELFKYLEEEKGGHDEVVKYWNYISDTYVADLLGKEVTSKGIRGCWDYWGKSLNEEACDFVMELDEKEGTFKIDMKACPSRGKLNSLTYMDQYHDYCGHCAVLYARQLEKYGINPDIVDLSRTDKAQCLLTYKCDKKVEDGEKLIMERKAADNEYFHRDFHISGERGLRYVGENYGTADVCEYLTRFAKAYYKPLIERIRKNGLSELKKHIEEIYAIEKAPENVKCTLTDGELRVVVTECPAIKYMKESGYEPSEWYIEETRTVKGTIAKESGYEFELISYNPENGAAEYRIFSK